MECPWEQCVRLYRYHEDERCPCKQERPYVTRNPVCILIDNAQSIYDALVENSGVYEKVKKWYHDKHRTDNRFSVEYGKKLREFLKSCIESGKLRESLLSMETHYGPTYEVSYVYMWVSIFVWKVVYPSRRSRDDSDQDQLLNKAVTTAMADTIYKDRKSYFKE